MLCKQHMQLGFDSKENFFSLVSELLFCARFLICRCKYLEQNPMMTHSTVNKPLGLKLRRENYFYDSKNEYYCGIVTVIVNL